MTQGGHNRTGDNHGRVDHRRVVGLRHFIDTGECSTRCPNAIIDGNDAKDKNSVKSFLGVP